MRESERFPAATVPALVFRASTGVYVTRDTFGALDGPNAGASDAWIARYDSTGLQL